MRPVRAKALNIARSFKAFALTGRQVTAPNNPGRCPGLRASALSGRAACIHCPGLRASALSGRAACIHCPGLRASAPSGRAACIHCPGLRASALSGRAAYMSFCPLPLLYPSVSDFQFRYAPVTVGSGRVGKNLRNFNYEPTLKSSFWFFSLQNAI